MLLLKNLGGDLPGRSKSFFRVKFKRFVKGSQNFRIYSNSINQKYDFNSCFLHSKKAKYLNSDLKKRNSNVLKIPRKGSLRKCAVILVLKWAFFKSLTLSGILVTILVQYYRAIVYRNQEKHFWALFIPKYKSSIKLGNILVRMT